MAHEVAARLSCALAVAALACGSGTHPSGAADGGAPPLGDPIAGLTTGQWTWVPFPDSSCGDGSPTGIGVNPGTGPDLLFFLNGGGACSSDLTCFTFPTATLGPVGEAQFDSALGLVPLSILDRTLPGNPFADATLVFVPYCTGDVHGGDRVVTYPSGTVHHTGRTNLQAYLKRIAATYPSPRRVVVSGSSAGGFGTLVDYDLIRSYYPSAQGIAVDDSGPPLESDGGILIQGGFQNWGISDALDPLCGGAGVCEADLSRGLAALVRKYPADRFALLSWNDDPVITAFYGLPRASDFTAGLLELTAGVIEPSTNARAFIAAGSDHTVLGHPASVSQNGVALLHWLSEQAAGSADWATVKP
jgi:Pectinacetylesterase